MKVLSLIEKAPNEVVLEFILLVIHGYTIMSREPELSADDRTRINNQIHYLAGHALCLSRGMNLEKWRFEAIVEDSALLLPSLNKHAMQVLKKLDPGSSPG